MTGFDRLVVGDAELEQDQQKADLYQLRDTLQQTQPLAQAQYRQSLDSQAQSTLDTLSQIRPQVEQTYRLGLDTAAKSLLNVFGQTRDWLGQGVQAAGRAIGGALTAPDEAVQQLTRYTPFNVAATVGQQIPEAAQALTERVTQGANQPVGGGPEGVPVLSGLANPHTVLPPLAGLAAGALLTPGGGEAGAVGAAAKAVPKLAEEVAPAAEAAGGYIGKLVQGAGPSVLPRLERTAGEAAKAVGDIRQEMAGNILLDKFPAELQPIIRTAVDRLSPQAIETARRGTIPEDTLRRLSGEVGLTAQQFVTRARPGKILNAEQLLALDETLTTTASEIKGVATQLADPAQATDALKAQFAQLSLQATALSRAAVGARAEAGRALQAYNYLRDASTTPTLLRRALALLGDQASDPQVMAQIAAAADDPVELFGLIRNLQTPSAWERFTTLYRANLLSSPLTQIRNIAGNTGALALILPERAIAATIDAARAALSHTPRERFFGEVPAEAEGILAAFGTATRRAGEVLTRGYTAETAQKLEQATIHKPFGMGPLGAVVEAPFKALSAGDQFFRTLAENGELWTRAYRQAASEGLSSGPLRERALEIVRSPSSELLDAVQQAGLYRTYNQTLGELGQGLAKVAHWGPMPLVVPFIATPLNIAKYELERSPLGIVSVGKAALSGAPAGEVVDRAARMALGSGIGASLYLYALGGNMTADAPRDPAERDLYYREGKQPYSIKIGDAWHSYSQLTGLSTTLALTAAAADATRRLGTAPTEREAMRIVWEAGKVLTEKPFLQGFQSLMQAWDNPTMAGKLLESTARGLVPASSLLSGIARATDPTLREAEGVGEAVQRGIPGLSQRLPEKLNAFGQPAQRSQSYVESLVNPIARTTAQSDPIDEELRRLTTETGETPGPAPIARTARIAGQPLTRDERRQLQELSGQGGYEALARLFASGEYLRATSDAQRVELVRRELSAARTRAGETVVPKALRPKKAS